MVSNSRPPRAIAAALANTYRDFPELEILPPGASEVSREIAKLPVLRPLELRKSAVLGNALKNPGKPYNLEVCLAYMRGELVKPCKHCLKITGPHVKCVVLAGFFAGSCTCCQYNNKGGKCSLRGRRPEPILDDADPYQDDDEVYVPGEDSDTPPANTIHPSRITPLRGSGNPCPTGPSLASRIGHEPTREFGIKGAANSPPQSSTTQQSSYREPEYDERPYGNSSYTSREHGQSYRDSDPRGRDHESRDLFSQRYEYDVRPSEHSSTLINRVVRDPFPPAHDYHRSGGSYSPPPLSSRIQQRHQPILQDDEYDDDPSHYSPPRYTRTDGNSFSQARGLDSRESYDYAPPLERRITQKPNLSTENNDQRRDEVRSSWPEIDKVPRERQTSSAGKRDATAAFGSSESMPPPKKKVQFAQGKSSVPTAEVSSTQSAKAPSKGVPIGPRLMLSAVHSEIPTGPRDGNSSRQSSLRRNSLTPRETAVRDSAGLLSGKLPPSAATNSNSSSQSVSGVGSSKLIHRATPTRKDEVRAEPPTSTHLLPQDSSHNGISIKPKDKDGIAPHPTKAASVPSSHQQNVTNSHPNNSESALNKIPLSGVSHQRATIIQKEAPSRQISGRDVTTQPKGSNSISVTTEKASEDSATDVVDHAPSLETSAAKQIPQLAGSRVEELPGHNEEQPGNRARKRKNTPPEDFQSIIIGSGGEGLPQDLNKVQSSARIMDKSVSTLETQEPAKRPRKPTPTAREANIRDTSTANLPKERMGAAGGTVLDKSEPPMKRKTPPIEDVVIEDAQSSKKPKTTSTPPIESLGVKTAEAVFDKAVAKKSGAVAGNLSRNQTHSPSTEAPPMMSNAAQTQKPPNTQRKTPPTGMEPANNAQAISANSGDVIISTTIDSISRKSNNCSPVIQPKDSSAAKVQAPSDKRKKIPPVGTSEGPDPNNPTGTQPEKSGGATSENLRISPKDVTPSSSISAVGSADFAIAKPSGTSNTTGSGHPPKKQKKTPSERSADKDVIPKKQLKQRQTPPNGEPDGILVASTAEKVVESTNSVAAKQSRVQKKVTFSVDTLPGKTADPETENRARAQTEVFSNPKPKSTANGTMDKPSHILNEEPPKTTDKYKSLKPNEETPQQQQTEKSLDKQTGPASSTPKASLDFVQPPPQTQTTTEFLSRVNIQPAATFQRLPIAERHGILFAEAIGMTRAERELALGELAFRTSVLHEANSHISRDENRR